MRKKHFTESEYKFARKEASVAEYAMRKGYRLIPEGKMYHLAEHDSMKFTNDGRWYWNSRQLKGGAIEFATQYEGLSLVEAVLSICETCGGSERLQRVSPGAGQHEKREENREFALPELAKDMKRLFAYLIQTRGIDKEIVADCVRKKNLYESVVKDKNSEKVLSHNAVFVGYGEDGKAHSAFQRGLSSSSSFKCDVAGSDPKAPFCIRGRDGATAVVVFEGAIDAMSHATVAKRNGDDWLAYDRIAIGGTGKYVGLVKYLDRNPRVETVILSMDEDDAGRRASGNIRDVLSDRKVEIKELHCPAGKDWNEYLTDYYGKETRQKTPEMFAKFVMTAGEEDLDL